LATVIDRPLPTVNEVIQGKRSIMPEMAIALAAALGETAQWWLEIEATYRLSLVKTPNGDVAARSKLFQLGPVKEMQRRGWLKQSDEPETLERELLAFYGIASVNDEPTITAIPRKPDAMQPLTPAQRAWCFRARQLASAIKADPFIHGSLNECEASLRKLAAYPQEARKVPNLLAKFGIRFVVVEPLKGAGIDGAAFWPADNSPVIAMSIRHDRVDGFWFTLMHEFSHIRHRDDLSVDSNLAGPDREPEATKPAIEQRADNDASASLIDPDTFNDFIVRVGSMYSRDRIVQFAHRIKLHPGIIVGQLQHRGEVPYSAHRALLVKIRDTVTQSSITDGWGRVMRLENLI
jgi:HTH-type transcriptional regulator/antitoxin HigA